MSVDVALPPTTWSPWSTISINKPYSYPVSCRQTVSWSATSSNQSQTFELHDRRSPIHTRPSKRPRTDLNLTPFRPSSDTLEDDQLFAREYWTPLIKITAEESIEAMHNRISGNIRTSMHTNGVPSRLGIWTSPRAPEDQELAVSPLESPPGFLDHISKESCDIGNDPLGDTEMATGEGHDEEVGGTISTETSSYTLERYLADGEGSIRSQEPSISRPDYLRSTDPIDIKRELQKLASDISDVFQGMNISDDSIQETHLQDLEASFGSEILEGLEGNTAGHETNPQDMSEYENDIFSLEDGDESVVVGSPDISPELESWILKSSLIVGSSLKPLVGGATEGTELTFQEEDVQLPIPHGRKRKASTCQ
ncbi:hypothetical protein TWF718_006871 [Orbilia javanica]|uniref:Uncharacterized protein n=1 Tax=Orbilia javanica TaxID=47235 RepID=A0AAN8RHT6_9PEZI